MEDPPEFFRGTGGHSTLQNIVRTHFPDFWTGFQDEHGGRSLPQYVIKEFEALLECGDRQMAVAAAHLVDSVFPDDAIARVRRAVERHGLDPLALGLPPRPGDEPRGEFEDVGQHEQPLLDFGDPREGDFFPGLKAASVQSSIPFGPDAGQKMKRVIDPDLARAAHLKRLEVQDDGMILWTLRRARWDGTRGFVMTPYQFLARLAALIPHPREHGLTYPGVFAPAIPLQDCM